ncbi:MAG: hypothetical protein AAFP28_12850 [Pseudomonadota bacterium]
MTQRGTWLWLAALPAKLFGAFTGLEIYASHRTYKELLLDAEFDETKVAALKNAKRHYYLAWMRFIAVVLTIFAAIAVLGKR